MALKLLPSAYISKAPSFTAGPGRRQAPPGTQRRRQSPQQYRCFPPEQPSLRIRLEPQWGQRTSQSATDYNTAVNTASRHQQPPDIVPYVIVSPISTYVKNTPQRERLTKTTIHRIRTNETYTGTLVWGTRAKDNALPVRVEDAFPAIVSRSEFEQVAAILGAKAPSKIHPRRTASPYLFSGIVKCETCGKALTAHESKSGQFTYYVCHSLLKQGQGACDTPRLNSKRFEQMIIDNIRENILIESNIRELVKLVNEELDSVIKEKREKLEAIEEELSEIRRRMNRLWVVVETTDLEINDILPSIREHQERQEKLEMAVDEGRPILSVRIQGLGDAETIAAYVREMSDFIMESELTETRAFIRSFVKEIGVVPGKAVIRHTIPMPQDTR